MSITTTTRAATEDWSLTKEIVIALAPIPGALLSFCASGTIIYMIWRSPAKLNKPFRRIIFGMSVYDMVFSVASIISNFPCPVGTKWGAIGNRGTCVTQGFLAQLGMLGSPLYSVSLAYFYLCMIKFNMSNEQFQKKVEMVIHVISNFLPWSTALFLVSTGNINVTAGPNCWVGPDPIDCVHDPDVECIRGENAYIFQWVFAGIPMFLSFLASFIIMLIIIWTMASLKRKLSKLTDWRQSQTPNEDSLIRRVSRRISSMRSSLNSDNHGSLVFQRQARSNRINRTGHRRNMQDDMEKQCLCYISANLFIHIFPYIFRSYEQINGNPPFVIVLLARVTNPLQGFLNILIYTRISVATCRATSGHSWITSFWIVVQSGMDHDERVRMTRNAVAGRCTFANGSPRSNCRLQNDENKSSPSILRSTLNQKLKSLSSQRKGVKFQDDNLEIAENKNSTKKSNCDDDDDDDDDNFIHSKKIIEQSLVYVDNVDNNDDILESNFSKIDDIEKNNLDEIDGVNQTCSSDDIIFPIPVNSDEGTDVARIQRNGHVENAENIESLMNKSESNGVNSLALEILPANIGSISLFKKESNEENI